MQYPVQNLFLYFFRLIFVFLKKLKIGVVASFFKMKTDPKHCEEDMCAKAALENLCLKLGMCNLR